MDMSGSSVFFGGSFTYCGGQTRLRIAAVDATSGNALGGWNPGANGVVTFVRVAGNRLFLYGDPPYGFNSLGGASRNCLAAVNAATGAATTWDPGADFYSDVYSVVASNSVLFVGGSFTNIGGLARPRIAALNNSSGAALPWDAHAGAGTVNALVLTNGTLYVGGGFASMGGSNRVNLAALDAATANATGWNPGANAAVETLALSGNTLYAGGTFTTIGGVNRTNLAALDRTSGAVLSWNPSPNHAAVHAIAVDTDRIYAAGAFVRIGGQNRTNVAALDPITGNALAWDPQVSFRGDPTHVRAVLPQNNSVFLGGDFDTVGAVERYGLAEVDTLTGAATGWLPQASGNVQAFGLGVNNLYVGGANANFTLLPLFAAFSLQVPGPTRAELTMPGLTDGVFHFRLLGTDGQPYVIEVSDDLSVWRYLDSVKPVNGFYDYTDLTSFGQNQRFYRSRMGL